MLTKMQISQVVSTHAVNRMHQQVDDVRIVSIELNTCADQFIQVGRLYFVCMRRRGISMPSDLKHVHIRCEGGDGALCVDMDILVF